MADLREHMQRCLWSHLNDLASDGEELGVGAADDPAQAARVSAQLRPGTGHDAKSRSTEACSQAGCALAQAPPALLSEDLRRQPRLRGEERLGLPGCDEGGDSLGFQQGGPARVLPQARGALGRVGETGMRGNNGGAAKAHWRLRQHPQGNAASQ